ncbi:MAG: nitrilase-related carbon-nitrogen hydrolase, partial [Nitrospiraceae bacterium]
MACTPKREEGLPRAIARVEEAARSGARVICLPELFRYPYLCQREDAAWFDLAEPVPGPTTEAIAKIARQKHVVV